MNREAERNRLVELVDNFLKEELGANLNKDILDKFADNILDDGWMRPPVKVGDELYVTLPKGVFKRQVFLEEVEGVKVFVSTNKSLFPVKDIGKTVFLTREEAEKALEGSGEK